MALLCSGLGIGPKARAGIGMSEEAVGTTLGVGTLAGLLAVIVAALLAKYARPMWPLIATSFATGVTYYWMVYCHTQPVFIWIMILQGITRCPIPRLRLRGRCRARIGRETSRGSSPAARRSPPRSAPW